MCLAEGGGDIFKTPLWAGILYLNFLTTMPDKHSYPHFTDEYAQAQRC